MEPEFTPRIPGEAIRLATRRETDFLPQQDLGNGNGNEGDQLPAVEESVEKNCAIRSKRSEDFKSWRLGLETSELDCYWVTDL